jgi:hypothetical protein
MKHTLSGLGEKTLMKMVVAGSSGKVLGMHMVGADAGEIIPGMAVAIRVGATKAVFDSTIGIPPPQLPKNLSPCASLLPNDVITRNYTYSRMELSACFKSSYEVGY